MRKAGGAVDPRGTKEGGARRRVATAEQSSQKRVGVKNVMEFAGTCRCSRQE